MTEKKLSRRDFLRMSALTATGAVLASCAPQVVKETVIVEKPVEKVVKETVIVEGTPQVVEKVVTATPEPPPAPKPAEGNVVMTIRPSEFAEGEIEGFETAHPGITIESIKVNYTRLYAMIAAGTPPDIIRASMNRLPLWVARGILMDLTPAFEASTAIDIDDLQGANKGYWFETATEGGTGKIYGMCKDWSNDFALYANTELITNGGLPAPTETPPLSAHEIREIAESSAVFEGDRIDVWGTALSSPYFLLPNWLGPMGMSLYKEDMTKIDLTGNEVTKDILRFLFDLAADRLVSSTVTPSASGFRTLMLQGTMALIMDGYWYGAREQPEEVKGKIMFLPSPTWEKNGPRQANCAYGVGGVVSAGTKVFDAAWEVYEWYFAGEPAVARAKGGWGIPALKSLVPLLPNETPKDQQRMRVLKDDLQYAGAISEYNPFLSSSAFNDSWTLNMESALRGNITFDELVATVEKEVNAQIAENISALF